MIVTRTSIATALTLTWHEDELPKLPIKEWYSAGNVQGDRGTYLEEVTVHFEVSPITAPPESLAWFGSGDARLRFATQDGAPMKRSHGHSAFRGLWFGDLPTALADEIFTALRAEFLAVQARLG